MTFNHLNSVQFCGFLHILYVVWLSPLIRQFLTLILIQILNSFTPSFTLLPLLLSLPL